MCGIAGILQFEGHHSPEEMRRFASAMAGSLAHRGPDDAGVWVSDDGRCALAHRRLSIIEPSPVGHQPMHSADGRAVITFNGEIYNYRELRAELEARGRRLRTRTDTEVLLEAMREWGAARVPAPRRDVRVRALRRGPARALARARPVRREAALLRRRRQTARVRVRAARAASSSRSSTPRSARRGSPSTSASPTSGRRARSTARRRSCRRVAMRRSSATAARRSSAISSSRRVLIRASPSAASTTSRTSSRRSSCGSSRGG